MIKLVINSDGIVENIIIAEDGFQISDKGLVDHDGITTLGATMNEDQTFSPGAWTGHRIRPKREIA